MVSIRIVGIMWHIFILTSFLTHIGGFHRCLYRTRRTVFVSNALPTLQTSYVTFLEKPQSLRKFLTFSIKPFLAAIMFETSDKHRRRYTQNLTHLKRTKVARQMLS